MSDKKLAVIDVGNTHIVLGVYHRDQLVATWRLDTKARRTEDEMAVMVEALFTRAGIALSSVSDAVIGCVVPPVAPMMTAFCRVAFGCDPLVVGPGIKTGVVIAVDNPREVGADRIANAAGALVKYDPPLLIVDFGTAITVDAISQKSEYLGGAIVPGIRLSLNALYHNAAKLPEVELAEPPSVIGKNTINSMQSGAVFGYAALVDGIVDRMTDTFDTTPQVIATGGEARLVAKVSRTINTVEEFLTLEGLRAIYMKNRG
jgi:type III pantothenate kinase